jgi:hypothetical protein
MYLKRAFECICRLLVGIAAAMPYVVAQRVVRLLLAKLARGRGIDPRSEQLLPTFASFTPTHAGTCTVNLQDKLSFLIVKSESQCVTGTYIAKCSLIFQTFRTLGWAGSSKAAVQLSFPSRSTAVGHYRVF